MDQTTTIVLLPDNQFWVLAIGMIVPVAGYLLNKIKGYDTAPEWLKGLVQVVLTAAAGGLYSALAQDIKGFDNVAQHCFSAVIASLYAHNYLWKPANVNVKLGARPSPTQTPKTEDEGSAGGNVESRRLVPGIASATSGREIA